jgi:hypothetical protein
MSRIAPTTAVRGMSVKQGAGDQDDAERHDDARGISRASRCPRRPRSASELEGAVNQQKKRGQAAEEVSGDPPRPGGKRRVVVGCMVLVLRSPGSPRFSRRQRGSARRRTPRAASDTNRIFFADPRTGLPWTGRRRGER